MGVIAGSVTAAVVVVALLGAAVVFFKFRRGRFSRRRLGANEDQEEIISRALDDEPIEL